MAKCKLMLTIKAVPYVHFTMKFLLLALLLLVPNETYKIFFQGNVGRGRYCPISIDVIYKLNNWVLDNEFLVE